MSSMPPAPPNPQSGPPDLLKVFLLLVGTVATGALVGSAINSLIAPSPRPSRLPRRSPLPGDFLSDLTYSREDQLALNREMGAVLENRVEKKLRREFPNATVISQVSVTTPGGKKRRVDFALAHPNGSVTPVEVKNVRKLQEKDVRQAEDHRDGMRHTHGVRSGPTIVVVPEHTIVSEEHEARVRIVRVPGKKKSR